MYITLYMVPRYEHEQVGLWCPHCLSPSGFALPLDRISDSGVTPAAAIVRKCADCDAPLGRDA